MQEDSDSSSIAEQFSTSGKEREGGDVPPPLGPPWGTRLADPDPPTPAKPGEGRYPDRARRRRGRKGPARRPLRIVRGYLGDSPRLPSLPAPRPAAPSDDRGGDPGPAPGAARRHPAPRSRRFSG